MTKIAELTKAELLKKINELKSTNKALYEHKEKLEDRLDEILDIVAPPEEDGDTQEVIDVTDSITRDILAVQEKQQKQIDDLSKRMTAHLNLLKQISQNSKALRSLHSALRKRVDCLERVKR